MAASKSGTTQRPLRARSGDDGIKIAMAQIARAYSALLAAGLGRLRSFYAARLAALVLTRRDDCTSAIAALEAERDAALDRLAQDIREQKLRAMRTELPARQRFHVVPPLSLRLQPQRPAWRRAARTRPAPHKP